MVLLIYKLDGSAGQQRGLKEGQHAGEEGGGSCKDLSKDLWAIMLGYVP